MKMPRRDNFSNLIFLFFLIFFSNIIFQSKYDFYPQGKFQLASTIDINAIKQTNPVDCHFIWNFNLFQNFHARFDNFKFFWIELEILNNNDHFNDFKISTQTNWRIEKSIENFLSFFFFHNFLQLEQYQFPFGIEFNLG